MLEDGKQKIFGSYEEIKKEGLDIDAILRNYSKMMSSDGKGEKKTNFKIEDDKNKDGDVEEVQEVQEEGDADLNKPMTREKTVAKQKAEPPSKPKKQQDLIQEEQMEQGMVGFRDYWNFISFSSGCCGIIMFFIVVISSVDLLLGVSAWLAMWCE